MYSTFPIKWDPISTLSSKEKHQIFPFYRIPISSRITLQGFGEVPISQHFSKMFTKWRENPANLQKLYSFQLLKTFSTSRFSPPEVFQLDQDINPDSVYQLQTVWFTNPHPRRCLNGPQFTSAFKRVRMHSWFHSSWSLTFDLYKFLEIQTL